MSSVSISYLQSKRAQYQRKLDAARNSLQSYENDHDSLVEFKGKLQTSQECFGGITTRENELLADIQQYYDVNSCAKVFIDKITQFTNGIGAGIVSLAYGALIEMASDQLKKIYDTIVDLNNDILWYKEEIRNIDEEIAYQSSLEVEEL